MFRGMKRFILSLVAAGLMAGAAQAQATCMAEYKAKRDNPLELFYDVAQVKAPCTRRNAEAQLRAILSSQGLTLLKVLSVTEN